MTLISELIRSRAKRYERMVAQYNIKDNNTAWDAIRYPRARSAGSGKSTRASRKRKIDDAYYNSFADHDEGDDYDPPPERKKPEQKPRIKTEPMPNMPTNYPPYMYQQMMPPYPQYVQRPMQPFMAPNSGLTSSYPSANFQFNQVQQASPNYPYQLPPQQSPYAVPTTLNKTQSRNIPRNQDSPDAFYHRNSLNYDNFEALLHEPAMHMNGNLLGEEFRLSLPNTSRMSQADNKPPIPVSKTEPPPEDPAQRSDLAGTVNNIAEHNNVSTEEAALSVVDGKENLEGTGSIITMQPQVKQEELSNSILISD